MATHTHAHRLLPSHFTAPSQPASAPVAEASAVLLVEGNEDPLAQRGDWVGFLIWVACFALMASMVVGESIALLFQ